MHTLLSHLTLALQVGLDVGTGRPRSFIYLFFSPSDRRRVWQFMLLNCRNCCRAQTFTDTVSCFWVAVGSEMFTTHNTDNRVLSLHEVTSACAPTDGPQMRLGGIYVHLRLKEHFATEHSLKVGFLYRFSLLILDSLEAATLTLLWDAILFEPEQWYPCDVTSACKLKIEKSRCAFYILLNIKFIIFFSTKLK